MIHRWQMQALIKHDSFATGLKSKCSKIGLAVCVCLEKLPRSYKDPEDFQLFQFQESAWEHQWLWWHYKEDKEDPGSKTKDA